MTMPSFDEIDSIQITNYKQLFNIPAPLRIKYFDMEKRH